eukprot:jgi/Orpsp1_1/1190396/evm.model.d7180000078718.1
MLTSNQFIQNTTLNDFNNYEDNSFSHSFYHVEFSKISKKYPEKCAFIFKDKEYSYSQIDKMSNSLANYLRNCGVGRNEVIPIISVRNPYYIIAVLAILKAGGTFMFIDPEYPLEYIKVILGEVKCRIILKFLSNKTDLLDDNSIYEYNLDEHNYYLNTDDLININSEYDICCLNLTSGTSTGKSKIVMSNHFDFINNCIYNEIYYKNKQVKGKQFTTLLAFSKFSFIMSFVEVFYSMYHQKKFVLSDDVEFNDPRLIGLLITKYKIDMMISTPSRIQNYLNNSSFKNSIKSLSLLFLVGELANKRTLKNIMNSTTTTTIYNIYGLTEILTVCIFEKLSSDAIFNSEQINLGGTPSCNYKVYILDEDLNPLPIGVEGEIFICSKMICEGYLNNRELTNETFVDCPFAQSNEKIKMMKTGDIGLVNEEGKIVIKGRKDFQLKIAGQKVNSIEIEKEIQKIEAIEFCVVQDKKDSNDNTFLVCYFISKKDITSSEIRSYLTHRIPSYMIPKYFKRIDNIPTTANGKLNRFELPEIQISDIVNNDIDIVKPITDIEIKLCSIYSRILNFNVEFISRTSNFYEIGGDIAKENKDKYAIVCGGEEISYKQLDEMSNSIAHYIRKQNIGRGDIVPIICERSYYYVIGALGIMKAGGAFLPFDPEYPEDHNKEKIRNSSSRICPIYEIDQHDFSENNDDIQNINEIEDSCYCLFTSGTTGKPKGCLISHYNLCNFSLYSQTLNGKYDLYHGNCNKILSFSRFTFDVSIAEIFYPLINIKKVVLCNDLEFNNPELIGNLIGKYDVDFLLSTPSRFKVYMQNSVFLSAIKALKGMIFGGENLNMEFCKECHKYTNAKIYNGYGPSETTVQCTLGEVKNIEYMNDINNTNILTIGKPVCNYSIYILDKQMKPVPIGVEGEIFIGGYGVGKGYLNHEELTREMFIECPFNSDDKYRKMMYRTGDMGRWTEEGEIEFLGRIDFQVKIHGQRIELGEIENVIKEIKEISQALVVDKKKENGEKYLVGYYISEVKIQNKKIKDYLRRKLPMYMVPNYYIKIEEIPLSNNGKLDRKRLPEPCKEDIIIEQYIAPENEIEQQICNIFSEVLNYPENEIGRMGDFYEFGGDSLNAIRVSSRIEKELNIKINIKDILETPVVCELGELTEKLMADENNISHQVDVIERHNVQEFPITSQQMGVYIDSIKHPDSLIYNVPVVLKLKENINIDKIKEGFNKLLEKQEILKSKYIEKQINEKIEIVGVIDKNLKIEFEEYKNSTMKKFVRPFNLSEGPLIRVGIVNNSLLMIDMHHIICDGTTISIIKKELNNYYENGIMDELEVHYSDYAIHVDNKKNNGSYEEQFKFYQEMFNENYEILSLPQKSKGMNNDEDDSIKKGSSMIRKIINKEQSRKIDDYVMNNSISKTSFFLSIYGYVLSKYSGQDNVYTSVISANRNSYYTENMIGMFVSTQPILLKYGENEIDFTKIIKDTMNKLIEIYNNQEISFSELI